MITMDEILKGRVKIEDLSEEIQKNLQKLHEVMNKIRTAYAKPMIVSSGYRRQSDNDSTANAAKKSAHLVGQACDIVDKDGGLMEWVLDNLQLMKDLGVYVEDPRHTRSWIHFQIRPVKSGNRVFKPTAGIPPYPDRWDGSYDSKYND